MKTCNGNDFTDIPCGMVGPSMKKAGNMVGLDLEQPIDCSQMQIGYVSSVIDNANYENRIEVIRKTELRAFVFNEFGEREELTIEFTLRSQRMPKPLDEG